MASSTGRKTSHRASSFVSAASMAGDDGLGHASMKMIDEFRDQVKKNLAFAPDLGTLSSIIDLLRHPSAIDDRKMLLEHVLVLLSRMPPSGFATFLQNSVVELLYNDLPHPPGTYVGQKYAFREADGSNNNLADPNMGKAGTTYSRSVQPMHATPASEMPDPGLVFDTLLRREKFTKHPAGLSSMMFSFAALVIHTVFRTSHDDYNVNETSSYVDLAPLYGVNQEAQDRVRKRDGRGLLHPDTFSEDRLLLLPPATAVLLVLFNRNHNYIAKKLLEINERGTFKDPDTISATDPSRSNFLVQQDEQLFQTARLINCTWFASAVFSDYFSSILGLVRQGSNWSLNPFGEIRKEDHTLFERGRGNVCSVEFNCLYRWHATTSAHDEQWVHNLIVHHFNKTPDEVTFADMKAFGAQMKAIDVDVTHWSIDTLQRQEDGTFKDEELAAILYTATENPAHAFGARSTPGCMRLHELMGIIQSRTWGVCSLNDFRRFLGLKPYSTFLEWNNDPEVAAAAEKLYGDIERLELYAGLQAEQAKPVVDGAGLCPSYTVSRAILADAIALTRGDRFYTADYTPFNMTSWGFADCQRDPSAPGYGSTLGRLFLRTLPHHYAPDSSYTWFPLMTPDAMHTILTNLGDIEAYDLARPSPTKSVPEIATYADVGTVLGGKSFNVPYSGRAAHVIKGDGFFIAPSDPSRGEREQQAMVNALTDAPGAIDHIAAKFYQKTRELMVYESWKGVGATYRYVDIVRDVLKFVPLYWASEVAGIKLKSKPDESDGVYTPQELYDILTEIYSFLFLDFDHGKFIPMASKAQDNIHELLRHIKNAHGRGSRLSLIDIVNTFARLLSGGKTEAQDDLASRLVALGYDNDTLANSILAVLIGSTVEMSQNLIHIVNFYLRHKPSETASSQLSAQAKVVEEAALAMQFIAGKGKLDAQDQANMQGFVLEALRLDPAFRGAYREALAPEKISGQSLQTHDHVFVDVASASLDPDAFANPQAVNPSRTPRARYLVADGVFRCLGVDLSSRLMSEVLRAVFSFPNVYRASQKSGELKRFKTDIMKTSTYLYLDKDQKPTPWPNSMVIQFD